jgi:hypothetical protein
MSNMSKRSPNIRTMKKSWDLSRPVSKRLFFFLLAFLAFSFCLNAAESVMKTLSAHVAKVAEDGSSVDVDFRHPATGETERLTFHVDDRTGLSGFEKLRELRAGQVVSIDYVEGEKHRLLIRRIARVKLSGPPAGLERFHGL